MNQLDSLNCKSSDIRKGDIIPSEVKGSEVKVDK